MVHKQESVQFELVTGTVTVDSRALEGMKLALQLFLDSPDFPTQFQEIHNAVQMELKSSAIWIHEGQAGIGIWRLENRDGRLVLVRYPPPRKGNVYLYHATLAPNGSGWKVVSFQQERELGPAGS